MMEQTLTILPIASGIIGILQNTNKLYSFWKSNFSKNKSIPDFLSDTYSNEENSAIEKSLKVLGYCRPIVQIVFTKYLYKFLGIIIVFILLLILYFVGSDISDDSKITEYISIGFFSAINYIICSPISNPFHQNFKSFLDDKNNVEKLKIKTNQDINIDYSKFKLISKIDQEFLNRYYNLSNLIYTLFAFKLKDIIEEERKNLTKAGQETFREAFAFIIKKLIDENDLEPKPITEDKIKIKEWEEKQSSTISRELKLNGLHVFVDYFEGGTFFKEDFVTLYKGKDEMILKQTIKSLW